MELSKIQTASWDDLVFEGRNKSYGAYLLRQLYEKNVRKSFIIALIAFIVLLGGPVLWKLISPSLENAKPKMVVMEMKDLKPPPPIEKTPPPPPPPPPPPVKSTIKFVPPVIKKDEEVHEDPPKQEEMVKVQVSNETKKGTDDGVDKIEIDPNAGKETGTENKIFTFVQQMPEYPGGENAMMQFIQDNLKYPSRARDNQTEGKVFVTFVVDEVGGIADIKVARDIGDGCGQAAVDVVKKMKNWSPGKQNGKAVRVQYTLPIDFTLQ